MVIYFYRTIALLQFIQYQKRLKKKEKGKIEKTVQISEKIKDKLEMKFDVIKVPAIRIQLGEEESEIEHEPKPTEFSTSVKQRKLRKFMIGKRATF